MLHEICCDQFYQKQIVFNPGLSVVLGTNTGDNSIGKSTFLLIVDYVFGGSTYAGATDIIENVGPHDIYFSFVFGEKTFKFCRNSINANTAITANGWIPSTQYLCRNCLSEMQSVDIFECTGKTIVMSGIRCTIRPPRRQKRHAWRFLNFSICTHHSRKQRP